MIKKLLENMKEELQSCKGLKPFIITEEIIKEKVFNKYAQINYKLKRKGLEYNLKIDTSTNTYLGIQVFGLELIIWCNNRKDLILKQKINSQYISEILNSINEIEVIREK